MNCREFEQNWNELLDAPSTGSSGLERALESHASACGRCRAVSTGYQVLRQAASAWAPPPAPSAGSLERLYALRVPSRRPAIPFGRSRMARLAPLASAAAVFALAWAGWSARPWRPLPEGPATARVSALPAATRLDPMDRPLGEALAEATEATIDLALEASAPAARIGREILDLDKPRVPLMTEKPAVVGAVDDPSAPGLIRSVGERVNAGVRPISGSARHAFSFLLGPPPGLDPAPGESRESL